MICQEATRRGDWKEERTEGEWIIEGETLDSFGGNEESYEQRKPRHMRRGRILETRAAPLL